ncbi:hypothetical protein [Cellvibrio sp. OA-2007]|uniref:hypothetical protein n=1 Tax=Cellvibrio sp. OA-2007 TaxID=529823 RepID=UPI000782CF2D|nr:hypothetical protein [Cellvibrio sp. OA-2007]
MKLYHTSIIFLLILLSGCQANSIKYNHLRAGSITPSNIFYESIRIGEVTSSFRKIPSNDLKEAFTKSLSGNNYITESDKFKVNVKLTNGDISGVFTNEVSLTIQYEVISTLTDTTVLTKNIESRAIVKSSKLAPLLEGINHALTGHTDYNKHIVTTNTYRSSRQEDIEFGFPDLGTPVNAKDPSSRIKFAIDTALRKNFADFLGVLNSNVIENY